MATAWVRSLSCRSYGVADAVVAPSPAKKMLPPLLLPVSCAAAAEVRDSVELLRQAKKARRERRRTPRERERREQQEPRPPCRPKKKPKQAAAARGVFMPSSPAAAVGPVSSAFLTMAELPEGHSSRRVVELIFSSGWGTAAAAEPAAVEAMFRVHSAARAVARFEEARAAARAHGAAARCGADGNEMMRFQCRAAAAGAGAGGVFGAGVATCSLGTTDSAVRTFASSGAAHAHAGPSHGRRAMLVCRVIAGRVRSAHHDSHHARHAPEQDHDSVDMGNGELIVLDNRAVLPCFLIIYKV